MPWKETGPMEQRRLFIQECLENGGPAVHICAAFGISRKTGYKWWNRFCSEGLSGLADRSRAPKRIPRKTAKSIEQKLLRARKLHASWGPRKLVADLARTHPHIPWPAASTLWQGQQLRILQAAAVPGPYSGEPGRVAVLDGAVAVATGQGWLRLEQVQLAGRGAMAVQDFVRGQRDFVGSQLG